MSCRANIGSCSTRRARTVSAPPCSTRTNFFVGNQSGYGLTDADAAVVIVARHQLHALRIQRRHLGQVRRSIGRAHGPQRSNNETTTDGQPVQYHGRRASESRHERRQPDQAGSAFRGLPDGHAVFCRTACPGRAGAPTPSTTRSPPTWWATRISWPPGSSPSIARRNVDIPWPLRCEVKGDIRRRNGCERQRRVC